MPSGHRNCRHCRFFCWTGTVEGHKKVRIYSGPIQLSCVTRKHKEISMDRLLKPLSIALMLATAPSLVAIETLPVQAQAADPAVNQVQGFYDALVASMKSGGTAKSRYERLKPAVEKAFDLSTMTATAVGPTWASLSDADKKTLTDAFSPMFISNYTNTFFPYKG